MSIAPDANVAERVILELLRANAEGLANIALMDCLEHRGVRAGDAIRGLRRLEARGQVYSVDGLWRLAAPARVA